MKNWKLSVGFGSALLLAGGAFLWADNDADAIRSAPAAVQSAVIQLAGTSKIHEFEVETEGGKTVYDVEYKVKDQSYEADIDPSGQIVSREVEVDLSIVPPAVLDAAKKAHADGKLDEASIVSAGGKLFYEIDVKVGNDSRELQIGADGTVIADSVEAPEAPEKPDAAEKGPKGDKDGEHEEKD